MREVDPRRFPTRVRHASCGSRWPPTPEANPPVDPAARGLRRRLSREDRAFRARFSAAYDGSYEPEDALWWYLHPAEQAPSGRVAPSVQEAVLARRAYQRGATGDAIQVAEEARAAYLDERERIAAAVRIASIRPRLRSSKRSRRALLLTLLPALLVAGIAIPLAGNAIEQTRTHQSTTCRPLPPGWTCRVRGDGTIIDAKPTPAWDRDATKLPESWVYTLGQGTAVVIGAHPPIKRARP